jgi:hypothetical protein
MPIHKDQCIQCDILRTGCNVTIDRQVGEEFRDLPFPHILRMTFIVVIDKTLDPMNIGIFCSSAVVAHPYLIDNLLKKR